MVSAGLLFHSLNRFSFYQKYIRIDNINIEKNGIKNRPNLTDIEEWESTNKKIIDINSADLLSLMELPGIGRETALKIIEYRTTHGNFNDIEDLIHVKGIGVKKLEMLKQYVIIK